MHYVNAKRWKICLFLVLNLMSVVNNLGSLIHNLAPEVRKNVRDLEKVSIKLCKTKCSKLFNSTCLKENILPKFTNIYIYTQ